MCPIVDQEPDLRLLNYQNNNIARISNLEGLETLIFLDLYANALEEISGLEPVSTFFSLLWHTLGCTPRARRV